MRLCIRAIINDIYIFLFIIKLSYLMLISTSKVHLKEPYLTNSALNNLKHLNITKNNKWQLNIFKRLCIHIIWGKKYSLDYEQVENIMFVQISWNGIWKMNFFITAMTGFCCCQKDVKLVTPHSVIVPAECGWSGGILGPIFTEQGASPDTVVSQRLGQWQETLLGGTEEKPGFLSAIQFYLAVSLQDS